jgi:cell division septation protein DedD
MEMDIGSYIGELLYQHDAVAVPGLGTFVNAYRSTEIDQVKGELHPPGKMASFNPNLVADDGLLVGLLQSRHHLGLQDAQAAVAAYVEKVKEAINRQEIVPFPEVGRLYQDYEKSLQFLPDQTNFSLDAYGLPVLEAYPVSRARAAATAQPSPATTVSKKSSVANYALMASISVAVVVVAVAAYFLIASSQEPAEAGMLPVPTSRVNVSPSGQSSEQGLAQEEATDSETPAVKEAPELPATDEEEWDSERPTPAPGQKRLVIIIGAFGNKENVTRLVDDIYDAGYEPYTEKSGPLTKVGVQKAYTRAEEVDAALQDVRNRFNSDAKLIKK